MTVRCVFTIWGCYGSNSEASIKKKVVSVILSLFCKFGHHETPLRPPSNSLGLRKGSQRCLTSQATPSTAQKNSPAQKSRFELIWNRSVAYRVACTRLKNLRKELDILQILWISPELNIFHCTLANSKNGP